MLDKLVATQKENNNRLASIEGTLSQILATNKKTAKEESLRNRREANLERRTKNQQSKAAPAAAVKATKEKKESENILTKILSSPIAKMAIGGLLIAGVVKAFSDPKTQEAIGNFFAKAFNKIKPIFIGMMQQAGEMLITAAREAGKIIVELLASAFDRLTKGFGNMFTGNQSNFGLSGAQRNAKTKEEREEIEKVNKALERKNQLEREYYKRVYALEKMKDKGYSSGAIARQQREVDASQEKLNTVIQEVQAYKELESVKDHLREEDTRMRTADEIRFGALNAMTFFHGAVNRQYLQEKGYQTGGPISVPGSGSGDTVPAIVSPGSFVLNREASKVMGYQEGGIPVMLEPGEKVYGPGMWGPHEAAMNSMIPRFQAGGFVGAPRASMTDTGYKDYKGRPVLLSPSAAEGFKCMVEKGMPVNPGDITNVFRDEAEYRRLISQGFGAASNSKHNFGEAMDVHGTMGQWIRRKGGKCGWGPNDYAGSHGGHYEFSGGNPAPARDEVYSNEQQTGPGSYKGLDAEQTGKAILESAPVMGAGNLLNWTGKAAQDAMESAGLPGYADYMRMFAQGFSESKMPSKLTTMLGAAVNLGKSLMGSLLGGLTNLFGGGQKQDDKNSGLTPIQKLLGLGAPAAAAEQPTGGGGGGEQPSVTELGGSSGKLALTDQQFKELAYIVSGEAARGTADEFGVAASVLNRVADPRYPSTIRAVGRQHNQYEAVEIGNARYDDALAARLKKNSHQIVSALNKLQGRTDFKGQALLHNRGQGDPMFSSRGNYFHYAEQGHSSTAPAPKNPPQHWRKFIQKQEGNAQVPKMQTGGVVNMRGSSANHMKRYDKAMETYRASMAEGMTPIVVPVPMGGGGGGNVSVTGSSGAPQAPELPAGPQVVALLELQNRLALGAHM